jgi:glycerophosphoryl diester phosphodiesterase
MIHLKELRRNLFLLLLSLFIFLPATEAQKSEKPFNHYMVVRTSKGLQELLHYNGKPVPFLSSHRGGPEMNLPENCIATFANTLKYTYSMMEIDPRYTKDSVLVVHHDQTLQRTTTGKGSVSDFNIQDLRELRLKDTQGNATRYQIPTFKEVLKWAKGKTILVLDKKDVPIEARVKMVEKHNAEAYCIVMAYTFEEAGVCFRMNKDIMMQVFIATPDKIVEFEKTGIPWKNVVVFVGHQKPKNPALVSMIHEKGARCIMGTSRNLDRDVIEGKAANIEELKDDYNTLLREGIDILETDIPVPVSRVLRDAHAVDPSLKRIFRNK